MSTGSREEIDGELPPATAPASIPMSVSGGFPNKEAAKQFADQLAGIIRVISSFIDLARLDGVTVADDYDGALQTLDRGFQATAPLSRSHDERITGVAMAASVLRAGVVKSHLVFYRPAIAAIADEIDTEAMRDALYTIAHECGHVEDLKVQDEAFPGVLLALRFPRADVAMLHRGALAMWEEYAACRLCAGFALDRQVGHYVTGLRSTLDGARERSNAAIRSFGSHRDVDRALREATPHIVEPLRMYSYLIGTLDGRRRSIEEAAPELVRPISESPYAAAFGHAADELRVLWDTRGAWNGLEVFDPLRELTRMCLDEGGVLFSVLPDGRVWVDLTEA